MVRATVTAALLILCARMAAEGMPFPWRWNGGMISTDLDVTWGMSGEWTISMGDRPMRNLAATLSDPCRASWKCRGELGWLSCPYILPYGEDPK